MREGQEKRHRDDNSQLENIPPHKKSKTDSTNDNTADTSLRLTMSKGYKIMEKMGYKEGQTLGENENALKEPIKVKIYSRKQGIRASKPNSPIINNMQMNEEEFRRRESEKRKNKRLEKNWYNIQKTAFEMMGDSEIFNPGKDPRGFNVLWRSYVIQLNEKLTRKNSNNEGNDNTGAKNDVSLISEEELGKSSIVDKNVSIEDVPAVIDYDISIVDSYIIEDSELAALRELSIEERITKLNIFLRSEKYYCFFCGAQYKDEGDLYEHCPGVNAEDHE